MANLNNKNLINRVVGSLGEIDHFGNSIPVQSIDENNDIVAEVAYLMMKHAEEYQVWKGHNDHDARKTVSAVAVLKRVAEMVVTEETQNSEMFKKLLADTFAV